MTKSVLSMLVLRPECGNAFLPGMEGRPDGAACYECEPVSVLPEEPRVTDGDDLA